MEVISKSSRAILSLLKNTRGFSMVGVIAAGGLLGGLALIMAEIMKQQMMVQKRAETGVEVVAISQRIVRTLYNGDACKFTLSSDTGSLPTVTHMQDIPIGAIKNKDNKNIFVPRNTYGNRLIKIDTLKVIEPSVNSSGDQAEAKLEVVMLKESGAITGYKKVTKTFDMTLVLDPTSNTVTHCNADAGGMVSAVCLGMGGTYDKNRNPKCLLIANLDCPSGEAVTKFENGVPVCKTVGTPPPTNPSNTNNCASLTNADFSRMYNGTVEWYRIPPSESCRQKDIDSRNNTCTTGVNQYEKYGESGCCYTGGNVTGTIAGVACPRTSSNGNNLEFIYCDKILTNCPTSGPCPTGYINETTDPDPCPLAGQGLSVGPVQYRGNGSNEDFPNRAAFCQAVQNNTNPTSYPKNSPSGNDYELWGRQKIRNSASPHCYKCLWNNGASSCGNP